MKAYSLIFGYFVINMAIWTLNTSGILPLYANEPIVNPSAFESLFSLDVFTVVTGIVGGGVVTVMALITRSYALSSGVLILWLVGVLLKPIQDVFVGLPKLVNSILIQAPTIGFIVSEIVTAFAAFILFMFVVEVIAGRQIT